MKVGVRIMCTSDGVEGITPVYMTDGAAGADCATPVDINIGPHETAKVSLCIGLDIPKGYCVKQYPRSSLLIKEGLIAPVGIIDSDYKGAICTVLHNLTDHVVHISKGQRVCQLVVEKMYTADNWEYRHESRDHAGFGGTGRI